MSKGKEKPGHTEKQKTKKFWLNVQKRDRSGQYRSTTVRGAAK